MDRKQLVRDLLENPLYEESIEELKKQVLLEWINTTSDDIKGRERLWIELRLIDKVYNHFQVILQEGKINEYTANLTEI
jgi:hypothetical protein